MFCNYSKLQKEVNYSVLALDYLVLALECRHIIDLLIEILEDKKDREIEMKNILRKIKELEKEATYNQKKCLELGGIEEVKKALIENKVETMINLVFKCEQQALWDFEKNSDYSAVIPPGILKLIKKD